MAITKQKKDSLLSDLREIGKNAKSIVFVSFDKLPVKETTELRRGLTEGGVSYKVAKKTLLKKALGELGITGEVPEMNGEIALAYSVAEGEDSLIAPSRGVYGFTKKWKDQLSIVGGVWGGAYKSQAEMLQMATIPTRDVLLSQLAYLLKSPMQRIAIAVGEVAKLRP